MQIPNFIKALAVSRKFWIALIVSVGLTVGYVQGAIQVEQLADSLVMLWGIVIAAIAGEDIAAKWNK
jgi:hypothetical protein